MFGEVHLEGKDFDLSALAHDVSDWRVLEIRVRNKSAEVFLEGKKIYSTKFKNNVGQIKGLKYIFKGSGAVDYVRLYNERNALVYEDNFDEPGQLQAGHPDEVVTIIPTPL